MKRHIAVLLFAVLGASVVPAHSQSSSIPLRFVVISGPGTGGDTITRYIAQKYGDRTGEATVVENRPGGDTIPAVLNVLNAPADGRSVLMVSSAPLVINPLVHKNLQYDPIRDFRLLVGATRGSAALVVGPDSRFKNFQAMLDAARAKPESVSVGFYGPSYEMALKSLERATNARFLRVSYKTSQQGNSDVIGGNVDSQLMDAGGAVPLLRSGRLKAMAVTGAKRHPLLPDVPTVAESGSPGFQESFFVGFAVRAQTPKAAGDALEGELLGIVRSPEFADFARQQGGLEPLPIGGQQLLEEIRTQSKRYEALAP